jgi:flagellin
MSIDVKTNVGAHTALKHLNRTSRALSRSFERISSGLRIARAADDAAGLGVAENLRAAHTSARVASRNTNDGISIIAVAEGASAEVGNILVRMRELAVQSSSETLDDDERAYIQDEFLSLSAEVDRIAQVTEFNGLQLSEGTVTQLDVQVGINAGTTNQITIALGDLRSATLGVDSAAMTLVSVTGAQAALTALDLAISSVSGYRADYGATENRLNNALNNLETFEETTIAAEARIRDADFGLETAQLSQNQILQQAGTSVLAQVKNLSQGALSLLQS